MGVESFWYASFIWGARSHEKPSMNDSVIWVALSIAPPKPCAVRKRRSFDSSFTFAPCSRAFQSLVMMGSPTTVTATGTSCLPSTGSSTSSIRSVFISTRPSAKRSEKGPRVHVTARWPRSSKVVSPLLGTRASRA